MVCSLCGYPVDISDLTQTSCQKCHSVLVPFDSIKHIVVVAVTNRNSNEETEWWNKSGCYSAFFTANPKLREALHRLSLSGQLESRINYNCGVVITSKEIKDVSQWVQNALNLVKVNDQDGVMIQHGLIITTLPSGNQIKCGLINVIVYASNLYNQSSEKPPISLVAINRQIVPV